MTLCKKSDPYSCKVYADVRKLAIIQDQDTLPQCATRMLSRLQTLWGQGQSRGFKLGAWATALGIYGAYYMLAEDKRPASIRDAVANKRQEGGQK